MFGFHFQYDLTNNFRTCLLGPKCRVKLKPIFSIPLDATSKWAEGKSSEGNRHGKLLVFVLEIYQGVYWDII